jgi:uncharacterized protein (TIGR00251 family)
VAEAGTRAGSENFVRSADDGAYLKLWVSPGAKSTRIKGLYGDEAVRLSVAAPPIEGGATVEIKRYLTRFLGVSRSEVAVVKGTQSRDKLVFVRGLRADELRVRLNDLL